VFWYPRQVDRFFAKRHIESLRGASGAAGFVELRTSQSIRTLRQLESRRFYNPLHIDRRATQSKESNRRESTAAEITARQVARRSQRAVPDVSFRTAKIPSRSAD